MAEWWGDGSYTADDLCDPRVMMRIVEADGTAFAFMQDYDIHGWEGRHFAYLPSGSRGTDQFIGDPAMIAVTDRRSSPSAWSSCSPPVPLFSRSTRILTMLLQSRPIGKSGSR
ncbi:hypothetical protein [uncultured Jannaschia sp.]|uniref:hypothetical protein n=1 Tax=uncultured Jannaschia sp. TaxID=293347 RepID=UPI00260D69C6|nr:hypothetical protein [uncultured Jannaschia sp.]